MTRLPLTVVALGGNALSPPSGDLSYQAERDAVRRTAAELATLAAEGQRLLIVHGNGPQVGRLLRGDLSGANFDVHVAQTQGELGYLLVEALRGRGIDNCAAIVTRVEVDTADPDIQNPSKPVGPLLPEKPPGPAQHSAGGWRLLVASPRPLTVLETPVIAQLLESWHVVAGGGGGIATTPGGTVQGVVDKDRSAALLAIELDAERLIFATDVAGAYCNYGAAGEQLQRRIRVDEIEAFCDRHVHGVGSMAPKLESAARFARETRRSAHIVGLGEIGAAVEDRAGTRVTPE